MFIKSDICGAEEAQTVSVFNSLFLIERTEKAMFNVTKCKEGSDHNFIRIANRKPTGFSPWEECEQPN